MHSWHRQLPLVDIDILFAEGPKLRRRLVLGKVLPALLTICLVRKPLHQVELLNAGDLL
jgi:hypothetical protein